MQYIRPMTKSIYLLILICFSNLLFGQFPPIDTYFFPQNKSVTIQTWEFVKNAKTNLISDSTLISVRKYNKDQKLTEYRKYFDLDTNTYDRETYKYDKKNNTTVIKYSYAKRQAGCPSRAGGYPIKKTEYGNEKHQLA